MRVLQIGKFFPPPFGGMETVLVSLTDEITRTIEADVLVSHTDWSFERLQRERYTVYKVPTIGTVAGTPLCPSMRFHLRRLLQRNDYDLIHLHLPNPMGHWAIGAAPEDVPVVLSWHSDIVRQQGLLRLYRPFLDRLLRRAAAVVAATPAHFTSSAQLDACPDANRRFVVPFGIDAERFRAKTKVLEHAAAVRDQLDNRPLIFALGRHVAYKGFEYLIRALPRSPDAGLILGGSGPLTEELQALVRQAGLGERVRFAGDIPDEELPAYYHAADVFCMPSIMQSEAFGLVQLQAMACRKPVICCELNNGVTDVNRHGVSGLVVPPRDPAALADALNRLLGDEDLRHRLGEGGYRRATSLFTLDRMREEMLTVYRRVVPGGIPEREQSGLRRAA